ncbi:MAG: S-layer homology domain-containing protein, partial [Ruminococcaceae bacterium]|nr:S-layer homology domain-containing protein [Oscillospiraceae bacterium]
GDALAWAVDTGLITGTTATTLAPKGQASRAEIATVLMRFVNHMAAQ